MRPSDRLRERAAGDLGRAYADGLLGVDTLTERVEAAMAAVSVGEVRALVADVPHGSPWARAGRRVLGALPGVLRADGVPVLEPARLGAAEDEPVLLGRSRRCHLVLDDPSVSRLHAILRRDGAAWWVFDAGSTNGTTLNGLQVRRARLRPGDVLALGSVRLRVGPPR